jgi:hypothetical protein
VALLLAPTYFLPFVLSLIFLIALLTASGFIIHAEQIVSSLYIERGVEQDLQDLSFPFLFCLFDCRYLKAIFSFVAISLQFEEQYI